MNLCGRLAAIALIALVAGCSPRQVARPAAAPVPGMMTVPRGEFTMGHDRGDLNERPAHDVDLNDFFMDRTEVSAADFAAFLNAEGNPGERFFTPDEYATIVLAPGPGREIRFAARAGYEAFPANNVSWFGAEAFCRWRGKRLPTEAEWEKAARGTDERLYPWGAWKNGGPTRARYGHSWTDARLGVLVPVDALPEGASAYGLLNMAGNVLEWVRDWYRQNLCDFCNPEGEAHQRLLRQLTGEGAFSGAEPRQPAPESPGIAAARGARQIPPRANPAGPSTGSFKVLRGGSWQELDPADLATTRRFWLDPAQRYPHTGFRCAKDAEREQPEPELDRKPQ